MELKNESRYEAELIHGPSGSEEHGVALILKKTVPLNSKAANPDFKWPVSLQDLKTDLAVFPFDHHFPIAKMDMMVTGFARPERGVATREMFVGLRVGDWTYEQIVFGDRFWQKKMVSYRASDPEPFTQMPLTLEQAFGGVAELESGGIPNLDNPQGKGFLMKDLDPEGKPLPNIERPEQLIRNPFDEPAPTCMGPYPLSGRLRYLPLMDKNGALRPFHGKDSHLYYGQAHPDLMMERLEPGTEITVRGMDPLDDLHWTIPKPDLECILVIDDRETPMTVTLDGICIFSHEASVGIKYRAAATFNLESRQERSIRVVEVSP